MSLQNLTNLSYSLPSISTKPADNNEDQSNNDDHTQKSFETNSNLGVKDKKISKNEKR